MAFLKITYNIAKTEKVGEDAVKFVTQESKKINSKGNIEDFVMNLSRTNDWYNLSPKYQKTVFVKVIMVEEL